MADAAGESYVAITIKPDLGLKFIFNALTGTEELGRPFEYDLDLSSDARKAELSQLLNTSVTVTVTTAGGGKRHFNGVVTRAVYLGLAGGAYRYRLELRPWIWLLTQQRDCRIFQNKTAVAIINQVFTDAGFSDRQDKRMAQSGEIVLEYCVQYDESSFDFVTRLMEKYGIYYYFIHSQGKHELVLADDTNSHASVGAAIPYRFRETEQRRVDDHVWEWSSDLQLQSGAVAARDYNFITPAADLTATSKKSIKPPFSKFEVFDYPGLYTTVEEGKKLTDVRMNELSSRVEIARGVSNARSLYCGGKFTLSKHPDQQQNREYLVTAATVSLQPGEGKSTTGGEVVDAFRVELSGIPGTETFRLEALTAQPTTRGPQTAVVTGASGAEIDSDKYGRIKVQFFWDRLGKKDQNSSCWIRVAQGWAGVSWGSIFIPRVGMEVIVDFLDGNPDRPIVTGCVYNAHTQVPYALPGDQTKSTIKSHSSKGGGGFNELRFEDKKDSEEIFFHAQKDYNKVVLHNETVKITEDTTTTVLQGNRVVSIDKGNNTLTVKTGNNATTVEKGDNTLKVSTGNNETTVSQGNNTLTVSLGNNSTTVSVGNDSLKVELGNHSIKVDTGSSTIDAMQSITLKVGSNSLVIDETGVTINGGKIGLQAKASLSANGGGSMTLTAGMIAIN